VKLKGRLKTVKDFLPFRQFGAGLYLHLEPEEWGQSDLQKLAEEIAEVKEPVNQVSIPYAPSKISPAASANASK
jgi:hypothetical protein